MAVSRLLQWPLKWSEKNIYGVALHAIPVFGQSWSLEETLAYKVGSVWDSAVNSD